MTEIICLFFISKKGGKWQQKENRLGVTDQEI